MTCSGCAHYLPNAFTLASASPLDLWEAATEGHGICRRYPPRYVPDLESDETMSLFPAIHADQRCGEHQPQAPAVPL